MDDHRGPRRYNSGPREMHKTTCSECGNECEVPFKPKEGRPVYCRDCFRKNRPPRGGYNQGGNSDRGDDSGSDQMSSDDSGSDDE